MPESDLLFHRVGSNPPVRPVCMYCGERATVTVQKRVRNPERDPEPSGGSNFDRTNYSGGNDGIFGAIIAWVMLAIMLWELIAWIARKLTRPRRPDLPPLNPNFTVVTMTMCHRHRRYWPFALRVWGAYLVALLASLALAWVGSQSRGESVGGSLLMVIPAVVFFLGILFVSWVFNSFPRVRVDDVRRETVRLVGISPQYFTARIRDSHP